MYDEMVNTIINRGYGSDPRLQELNDRYIESGDKDRILDMWDRVKVLDAFINGDIADLHSPTHASIVEVADNRRRYFR